MALEKFLEQVLKGNWKMAAWVFLIVFIASMLIHAGQKVINKLFFRDCVCQHANKHYA